MNVLDIGCGWGGMAIEIAKLTGAKVKGITLSENQFKTASERAHKEGLSEKVSFALQDYRNENNKYDRIVSVGMFEHVGVKYFKTYLQKAYNILNDNGVFLYHWTESQQLAMDKNISFLRYIPSLKIVKHKNKYQRNRYRNFKVTMHIHFHWYKNVIENKDKLYQCLISVFLE